MGLVGSFEKNCSTSRSSVLTNVHARADIDDFDVGVLLDEASQGIVIVLAADCFSRKKARSVELLRQVSELGQLTGTHI